jgi:lysozyme family protein
LSDNFDTAIGPALLHEGGYVNDPDDPGGATNFGITLGTLQDYAKRLGLTPGGFKLDVNGDGHIDVRDIRAMTRDFAVAFYKKFVWQAYHLDQITDAAIAAKVFDMSINLGPGGIGKVVRNALIANGVRNASNRPVGPIDAATIATINAQDPVRFLTWLKRALVANYQRIAEARPTSQKFLRGWIARANS